MPRVTDVKKTTGKVNFENYKENNLSRFYLSRLETKSAVITMFKKGNQDMDLDKKKTFKEDFYNIEPFQFHKHTSNLVKRY
jgi:hypothetical protein